MTVEYELVGGEVDGLVVTMPSAVSVIRMPVLDEFNFSTAEPALNLEVHEHTYQVKLYYAYLDPCSKCMGSG